MGLPQPVSPVPSRSVAALRPSPPSAGRAAHAPPRARAGHGAARLPGPRRPSAASACHLALAPPPVPEGKRATTEYGSLSVDHERRIKRGLVFAPRPSMERWSCF
ncbi:hypothetical protein PVAP13_8KG056468 [Panicum virgatum]|uniref:Uncharacterized protein n=1 Tax=Panicum virgatum TaxID=38727 RepID=A0A8T0PDT3_PANVG|nr:hypothetical protein PVAP13_8KG056468 [Panicum virgatum]